MVHGLLICRDSDTRELLGRFIRGSGQIVLDRFFCPIPTAYELTTALQTLPIDVVYLDTSSESAQSIGDQIRSDYPGIALIGFSTASLAEAQNRVAEFSLELPFSVEGLLATTRSAISALLKEPYRKVVAILPSKAGSGASTIAINLAANLAALSRRVILVDADLRSGAIGDCIGMQPRLAVAETLSLADVAAQLIWPRHVTQKDGIDFLLTDRDPGKPRPEWHSYHHLLRFLNDRYDHIVVDLPELANDATSFALQHAWSVYLAVTPEPLSLKLAHQRLDELKAAGVDSKRIGVLVNRWERGCLSQKDIEQALAHPVTGVFPGDYRCVSASILEQRFVPFKTKLGQSYRSFATNLTSSRKTNEADPVRVGLLDGLRFLRKAV